MGENVFVKKKSPGQNLCSGAFGGNIRPYTKQRARHGSPFLEPPPPSFAGRPCHPAPPPAKQFSGRPEGGYQRACKNSLPTHCWWTSKIPETASDRGRRAVWCGLLCHHVGRCGGAPGAWNGNEGRRGIKPPMKTPSSWQPKGREAKECEKGT